MQKYVLGFLFDGNKVVLIRKLTPAWQRGKLNGVGGKTEPGETSLQAMVREFQEETGALVTNWKHFATMSSNAFEVVCYHAEGDSSQCFTKTAEQIIIIDKSHLGTEECLDNIKWLIEMALSSINPDEHIDHLNIVYVRPSDKAVVDIQSVNEDSKTQ